MFLPLLFSSLLLAASAAESSAPPGDPPPSFREARSGLSRFAAPEPQWQTLRFAPSSSAISPSSSASVQASRTLRFIDSPSSSTSNNNNKGFQPLPPSPADLSRDYRFEPYYRQNLAAYERSRDRDYYESARYQDYNRPRRVIYFEDLSNRNRGPYFYPQPQPFNDNRYSGYRGGGPAGLGGSSSPYRYINTDGNRVNGNSIVSEGVVENAPLDDPYRNYNPRQPAPWSVQVGTSLTVNDDGRHGGGAGRRFYVQSQNDEPLARSLDLQQDYRGQQDYQGKGRFWSALQPRV